MPVRPNALRISSKLARMQTARFTTIIVVNQQVKYDLDQVINCRGKGDTAWFETLLNTVSEKRVTVRDIPRVVKLIRSNTGLSFNARTCFNGLPSLDQHCTERYISSDPFFFIHYCQSPVRNSNIFPPDILPGRFSYTSDVNFSNSTPI